jgi:DegV family protein with EDD domain
MTNVRVVVDSTADLPQQIRESLSIAMVPLKVHFGNDTYLDSITMSSEQFFAKLAQAKEMPTTSQPSPLDFLETYKKLLEEPDTAIVSIHISSALSGTYQSAVLAKSMLEEPMNGRVSIVDSKSASLGVGFIAMAVAAAAANGADVAQCLEVFQKIKQKTKLYFLVETLEFLHRNGRIGKASALFGSLLNIKPILSIDEEGMIFPVDKIRGSRKAMSRIMDLIETDFGQQELEVTFVHANAMTAAQDFSSLVTERLQVSQTNIYELGPVIGTHVGPGTLGILVSPVIK